MRFLEVRFSLDGDPSVAPLTRADPYRGKICPFVGKYPSCGLYLQTGQVLEVHHRDRDQRNNRYANLALVHGHCHDAMHRSLRS